MVEDANDPVTPSAAREAVMSGIDRIAQVSSRIEQSIRTGEFAPGDRLPSEREFSARLGVSRSMVREALRCLAGQGLVRSYPGSGTRIAPPDSRLVTAGLRRLLGQLDHPLEDLCAVRMALEPAIASLAAIHREDEHLARMEKAQLVIGNPRRSLKAYVEADIEFHACLADASGNPIFNMILEPIQELLREGRRQTIGHFGLPSIHETHGRVLEAVRARDPDGAERAMRQHIAHATAQVMALPRNVDGGPGDPTPSQGRRRPGSWGRQEVLW